MKYFSVIVFFLLVGLVVLYFSKESGHSREVNRLTKERDSAIQRMNNEHARAEEWRQRAFDYGNQFRKEATRALKAENRFNYLREENEKLKIRPVIRYTDNNLDSLFRARYSKD